MTAPRITLLSRPGCHLCDDARGVISKVADDLGVAWEERDITASEADLREYWDKIPVTLVDGVQHDFWRVSADRLRQALRLPAPRPGHGRRATRLGRAGGRYRGASGADFVHLFTNDVW